VIRIYFLIGIIALNTFSFSYFLLVEVSRQKDNKKSNKQNTFRKKPKNSKSPSTHQNNNKESTPKTPKMKKRH